VTRQSIKVGSGRRWRTIGASCAAVALAVSLGACSSDDDASATTDTALAAETARADALQLQLDQVTAQFPITVTASLADFDVIGAYTLTLTQAYCEGLDACGVPRPAIRADIVQGSNGLELKIPNVLTAGLFDVNGSLFAVTDSDQILEPCGTTTRNARISITIFADGIEIAEDGKQTLTGMGASLLVSTDAVDDCTDGVVFFAATLTPV